MNEMFDEGDASRIHSMRNGVCPCSYVINIGTCNTLLTSVQDEESLCVRVAADAVAESAAELGVGFLGHLDNIFCL